ncbi:N-acyl-D-amino acid deacylase [Sorangium cellulosum]|uniref:N-acyl-D-amino acid deacylase n=1 Tax=Sorangium cellulosum TaxID=56 RepID=A0A150SEM6_SORCE|nr:N-acyl-D-amino acid deacylase [Sorangium cellulosum]
MEFDLVVSRGTVLDGSGQPRYVADVGIQNGKIAAIAGPGALKGGRTLDAGGLAVAPGFIDIHSHVDWLLPLPDHEEVLGPMVAQGITTVVAGNCGHSPAPVTDASIPLVEHSAEILKDGDLAYRWRSMGELLSALEGGGLLLNAALLVGHGTLRQAVMGNSAAAPSPRQLQELCSLARASLREGAFGLSAGLAYTPGVFSRRDELLILLRTVADEGGVFTVHGRAYTWVSPFYKPLLFGPPHNLRSVRELLGLAEESRARIQLSHQIFIGRRTWPTAPSVLRAIERAVERGVDAAFDAFPYTVGNTTVNALFPGWVLDDFRARIDDPSVIRRLRREFAMFRLLLGLDYADIRLLWGGAPELEALEGLDFGEIAGRLRRSEFDAYVHVARASDGKARILLNTYSGVDAQDEPLRAVLSHPLCAFETDAILTRRGRHNPASFGTFPRVLGHYSRDLGLFRLEEAVRRMTSLPAERIGLRDVGRIVPGHWADLVVFDPATVADNTTPGRAEAPPSGIRAVLITGEEVARDGALTSKTRQGRVLRR